MTLSQMNTNSLKRWPTIKLLIAISSIYALQSAIGGLTFIGLPAILRSEGYDHHLIGMVFLAMAPWSLKFLWAPYVEKYRIKNDGSKRSKAIILIGQFILILCLFLISQLNDFKWILCALIFIAVIASTIDIAADALTIEQVPRNNQNWGSFAQTGSSYIGILIGGGLFVTLVSYFNPEKSFIIIGLLLGILSVPLCFIKEEHAKAAQTKHTPSLIYALKRKEVIYGLIMISIYAIGNRLSLSMIGPLLVDSKISLYYIGLVNGIGGALLGLAGALAGSVLLQNQTKRTSLLFITFCKLITVGGITLICLTPEAPKLWILISTLLLSYTSAMGFVIIYAILMSLSSKHQAGVDFTLFQSADTAIAVIAGIISGYLVNLIGYSNFYFIATSFSLITCISFIHLTKITEGPKTYR
ncbi:MFS transporter [Kiloniella litopenaei]|nr:MFS transporter [Kiloniella litopenaei]